MDGVLVDNMMTHMEAFAEMARRYGVALDIPTVLGMAGKGNDEIFGALFPSEIVERVGWKALGLEKEATYRKLYAQKMKPAEGLIAFLDGLKDAGIKIAVGTSAIQANMDFIFDGIGIRKYFDAIVNADMVERCKPDPEIYLVALRELGIEASECLVFEDAIAGVQAAHAAGIKVVVVSTTVDKAKLEAEAGVVLTIKDFTEITPAKAEALVQVD